MERFFAREIESLRLGHGEVFHCEGILVVTNAPAMADEGHSALDAVLRGEGTPSGVPSRSRR